MFGSEHSLRQLVRAGAASFDAVWDAKTLPPAEAIPDDPSEVQTAPLVPSYSKRCEWHLACLHAGMIDRSLRHVYVTSPNFGPGTIIETALRAAATRGVDVRLLVPRKGDPPAAGWATRAAYEPLLASGVRIFEYQPRKLHAKSIEIDGEWTIVGSANLDYLSLFVNHELILVARERRLL